jgi:hypothetical protein
MILCYVCCCFYLVILWLCYCNCAPDDTTALPTTDDDVGDIEILVDKKIHEEVATAESANDTDSTSSIELHEVELAETGSVSAADHLL